MRPRIVWADDNADMRAYVRRLLEGRYDVETCADGVAALAAIRRRRPDLVLSDIMMPRLDGMGLLRAVRSDPRLAGVPVILLSARAGEESRIEGMDGGADDYLIKPFSARELVSRVEMHARLTRMRRKSQALEHANESRFRAFIQATSDAVYQMSPDWQEMRFLDGRDFIADTLEPSQTWLDKYIPPDDRAQVLAAIQEAIRTQSIFSMEHRVVRLDGTPGWIFSRAVPLRDAQGRIVEWFGAASDVTARKTAEQALLDMDRRKDEFIATLSHELRNPLAPLANSLHLLRRTPVDEPIPPRVREMMERQVNHLIRLVDDLLELSRISRGTLELRRERVAVATVVRNAAETVEPMIREGRHRLQISLPAEPLSVNGDPVRLAQILANLLNNATRYSDPGKDIHLDVRREGESVLIEIRDHGIGIEAESLPHLFEMFSRGQRLRGRGQGGLGIGLALARRLAEMHGGSIDAASDGPDRGASFTVHLPLSGSDQDQAAPSAPAAWNAPGVRVLVVDDNHDAATSLAMLLQALGIETRIAGDGNEALGAYAAYRPDVVLLDIGMPDMDGYEVARRLRASQGDRRCLLVALTGWGQEDDRRQAAAAGFDHHLVKPADIDALYALLASVQGAA